MTQRTIGTLSVAPICLGSELFGATIDESQALALLDAYVAAGGNFIDTARIYNDWLPGPTGRSEKTIGKWLASRGHRERVVIATKGAHSEMSSGAPRLSPADIQKDLDASLRALGVETIDLYWLHRDHRSAKVGPIIDALNGHVRAGKIRHFGCSNWRADRIRAANEYASASGQAGFVANQPMWSAAVVDRSGLTDQSLQVMDADMRRFHLETGMPCVPYSSQARGLFTKGFLVRMPHGYPWNANRRRRAALSRVAAARSLSMTQVVLAYLTSQPFTTVPIVGCRTLEQLRDSLTALDVRLPPEDLAAIDAS